MAFDFEKAKQFTEPTTQTEPTGSIFERAKAISEGKVTFEKPPKDIFDVAVRDIELTNRLTDEALKLPKDDPKRLELLNIASKAQKEIRGDTPFVDRIPPAKRVIEEIAEDPLSLKSDITKVISSGIDSLKETFEHQADASAEFVTAFSSKNRSLSEKVGKGLKLLGASGGVLFSPITAFFASAKEVPVVGTAARAFELPFIMLGEGGSNLAGGVVDLLPIPENDKEKLKEGAQAIGALAAQLVGAKAGIKAKETTTSFLARRKSELATKFGEKDAQTIVEKAQEIVERADKPKPEIAEGTPIDISKVPLNMKMGELAELAKQRGFEIPEFGKQPKGVAPQRQFIDVPREQLPVRLEKAEQGISALEARMKGITEEVNVNKAKLEAQEKGLDISVYDKISKPEAIRAAADYVNRVSQKEALEVLRGDKPTPKGLLTNAVMLALEAKSLRDKNVDLAIRLASLRSTRMGQEISILTEVSGTSPVSGLSQIIRARRDVASKKLKQGETLARKKDSIVNKMKIEQTNQQLKMSEAEALIKEITC